MRSQKNNKSQHVEFLLESPDELVCKVINKVVDLIPVVLYTSRPEKMLCIKGSVLGLHKIT